MEFMYIFVFDLVKVVVGIYYDIQLLIIFYFGGDEVVYGVWINFIQCEKFVQSLGFVKFGGRMVDKLKEYFVQCVFNIIVDYNFDFVGWEDGLMSY